MPLVYLSEDDLRVLTQIFVSNLGGKDEYIKLAKKLNIDTYYKLYEDEECPISKAT